MARIAQRVYPLSRYLVVYFESQKPKVKAGNIHKYSLNSTIVNFPTKLKEIIDIKVHKVKYAESVPRITLAF